MRQMGIRRSAALRGDGRDDNRSLEHVRIRLLFISRSDVPGRGSPVRRGNSAIESIILVGLLRALLLHPFDGVEMVLDGRPLGRRQRLLAAEKGGRTGRARYGPTPGARLRADRRTGSESAGGWIRLELCGPHVKFRRGR